MSDFYEYPDVVQEVRGALAWELACKFFVLGRTLSCSRDSINESNLDASDLYEVNKDMLVGAVVARFKGINSIYFECVASVNSESPGTSSINPPADAEKKTNAFEMMGQSRKRSLPEKKHSSSGVKVGLNRKDEMYNDVIGMMREDGVDFPATESNTDGAYIAQVMCNALWYTTNQHLTFKDAALHQKNVSQIPAKFEKFGGYNELKRKRQKEQPMSSGELYSYGQALYSLCMKPIMQTNVKWVEFCGHVRNLGDCLLAFSQHLREKASESELNRNRDTPARTVANDVSVEHRLPTKFGNPGRLKLQSTCVTFKNIKTGKVDQYQSSDIEKAYWLKRARGHCLKIVQENGAIHRYDGIKESEFEKLSSFVSKHYNTTLEKVDMSLKGWNWGSTKFEGSALNFMIGSNLAFEIPLNNVSHTTPSKNEVTLEFHQNDDAQVSLMEMRFHIPPDQANPEADNVQEFYRNVLDKADVIQLTGESIAVLTEVQCLTPRGRYDFKMYPTFLQLHGKTFDYKVPYTTVIRLFLLPHKDGRQMFFVVSVDPPVKQGQTRYHFIIMLFNKEEEMTLEMAMDEEEIQKKYEGRLEKTMSGLEHEIISKLFRAVTNRKITVPGNFISHRGVPAVSCSYKASTGLLFPLERGFIFVHKPPIHIRFDEVTFVNFARSAANLRSFDFEVETKMGTNHSFGSIDKDEYGKLYDFVSSKKLRVKNTGGKKDSGGAAYGDDMVDSDMESDGEHDAYLVRMKREGKDRDEFDEDDETDSSDESYNPDASGSDVAEEFQDGGTLITQLLGNPSFRTGGLFTVYDSNPPTSSDSDSDYSDSGSDSGSERREKKEKKKRRSAKTVPEGTIGLKESKPKKTTPKTKGKKKKKDKDQPKRPQSAYFLWLGEHREEIKKENPGINVIDISKKAGEMWKALEDKTEWDKKAAEAKEEYNEAMKEWKKKVAERGDNDEDDESEDEKPKKREKSTKKRSPKKSPSKATESKGGSGAGYKSKEFLSSSGSDSSSDDSDKPLKKKKKEESENSSDAELPEDEAILSSPPVSSESESDSD